MQRKIAIDVEVGTERRDSAVWVDDDATDAEREAAVEEVVADVRSWSDEPVELVGWGETGTVKGDGWDAMPRQEPGW